jgi:hypothetical protein
VRTNASAAAGEREIWCRKTAMFATIRRIVIIGSERRGVMSFKGINASSGR